jgi:hypothetical protein
MWMSTEKPNDTGKMTQSVGTDSEFKIKQKEKLGTP